MSSAFGNGSNSNGQFWYGSSLNFPGFLYKKNVGVGGRRSTKFNPGGNVFCNKSNYFYNKYKPGTGGVGASSIANRRAKNRLATVCVSHNCFPYYMTLGQYSNYTHNPNGFINLPPPPPRIIYNSILINGVTRKYITININSNNLKHSILLCFPGGGESETEFLNYTNLGDINSSVIIFEGQISANKYTFQNAFPWIYNSIAQNDVLFADTVLNTIYNNNIPKNIFLTGKSDGGGFTMLYSNLSVYRLNIRGIFLCSSAHFGINSVDNISIFSNSNYYIQNNNITIPYNIIVSPSNISVFIIHGTADTVMPYNGENYTNSEAYNNKNKTIWKKVDTSIHETDDIIYTNTFTVNIPDYSTFIKNNNNLNQIYNNSNNEKYNWNVNQNSFNVVLNEISIIGQDHDWSGHYDSGPKSNTPYNFYLDATYLLIKFFKLDQGNYIPTITEIPYNLKTYDNKNLN